MREIQGIISERAVELLNLSESSGPGLLLDIGCGTGMSGNVIESLGHCFMGIDISENMLRIARDDFVEEQSNGDVLLADMGQGLGFRQGIFDGAISISAVQWLCYASKTADVPKRRLRCFFNNLYRVLKFGARAVLQIYPENSAQMELITNCALTAGFTGGLVVDYPNSAKAKKYYLCLFAGVARKLPTPKMEVDVTSSTPTTIPMYSRNESNNNHSRKRRNDKTSQRQWVIKKKERQRRQGKTVKEDTKYTGRKRSRKF